MTKTKKTDNILLVGSMFLILTILLLAYLLRPRPKDGFPPDNMDQCTVILGAKLVGTGNALVDPLAALSGARHLFLNYFLNQTTYGIIEGGHIITKFGYRGLSTAHIKPYAWDHGGFQWRIPTSHCVQFIDCLYLQTIQYHHVSHPYHFLLGPNSNSFMWWILHQCSINLTPTFSKYPFVGIDYFWSDKIRPS